MDELAAVKDFIRSADIPDDAKHSALWCAGQLPGLFEQLFATYDSRFREEILRLEGSLLKPFGKKGGGVAGEIRARLHALHVRLGFEGLGGQGR